MYTIIGKLEREENSWNKKDTKKIKGRKFNFF